MGRRGSSSSSSPDRTHHHRDKRKKKSKDKDRDYARRENERDKSRRDLSRDKRDREPDRRHDRGRDTGRDKDRHAKEREHDRHRSHDRGRHRTRSRSRSRSGERHKRKHNQLPESGKPASLSAAVAGNSAASNKEDALKQQRADEQATLEMQMEERRRRVEEWRRKKQQESDAAAAGSEAATTDDQQVPEVGKGWSLEDDDEEEDTSGADPKDGQPAGDAEMQDARGGAPPGALTLASRQVPVAGSGLPSQDADDEVDPLDAFMSGLPQAKADLNAAPDALGEASTNPGAAEEEDPLDAFMSGQVMPRMKADVAAVSDGAGEAGVLPYGGESVAIKLEPSTTQQAPSAIKFQPSSAKPEPHAAKPTGISLGSRPVMLAKRGFLPSRLKIAAPVGTGAPSAPAGNAKKKKPKSKLNYARYETSDESSSEDEEESSDEDDEAWAKAVQAGRMSKGDRLGVVDHSTIEYAPFRKNFYIEVPELARMDEAELAEVMKADGIKVRGKNVPKPIRAWTQCGLSGKLLDVLKKSGCDKPLAIQAQALPIIMSGRDCIGIAKTGSGKTLGFVLPMMRHVKDQPPLADGDGPIALVLAPTRELVQQIAKEIKKFGKPLGLTCVPVFGGSGVANQISDLKRGTEIIVCTPGRMIDLLTTANGKITNLRRVTYLVLDEADRMFDMGFEPQIMRIVQNVRPDRQTVMFSATFPRAVETVARNILVDPLEIQVGGRSVVNPDIEQIVEIRPENDRFLRLLEVLGEWYGNGKIILFVQSQEKCDTLFRDLLNYGYPCLSLHGGKDQTDREGTISDFKGDVCNILVATSVAARGLDVKDLVLVVNYDPPNHHEDYVHRVGRTGRAGNKGTAITFIGTEEEQYAPDLVKAMKESGKAVPEDLKTMADAFNEKRKQGLAKSHGTGFGGTGHKFDRLEEEQHKQARKTKAKEMGLEVDDGGGGAESSDSDDGIRRVDGTGTSQPVGGSRAAPAAAATAAGTGTTVAGATISADAMAAMRMAGAAAAAAPAAGAPGTSAAPGAAAAPAGAAPAALNQQQSAHVLAAQAVAARLAGGVAGPVPGAPTAAMPPANAMLQGLASIPGVTISPAALGVHTSVGIPGGIPINTAIAAAQKMAVYVGGAAPSAATAASTTHRPAVHFEAELEVNDFPQHARWKVMHRETINDIAELTGCALITKGVYVPPGKQPPPGERKIFLLIEGKTEQAVKRAKQELKRIIEEATEKTMRRDAPAAGRYVV